MAISEDLQRRINTLTQGRDFEREFSDAQMTAQMAQEYRDLLGSQLTEREADRIEDAVNQVQTINAVTPASAFNRLQDLAPQEPEFSRQDLLEQIFRARQLSGAQMSERELVELADQTFDPSTTDDPELRESLMNLRAKMEAQAMAPMGEMAQELAAMGGGEDTALAHVRPGEVVVPPEIVEDPEVESLLESKFNQMGINPEEAVVGVGIASLNPSTGLEQFGFFKKIGKKLGKIVKKVAPIAVNFIPGVGPVARAALTAGVGKASGLSTKDALLAGGLSFAGNKMFGGSTPTGGAPATGNIFQKAKEYILPGQDKVGLFGNVRKGITSLFGGAGPDTLGTLDGQPITAADYKNLTTEQIMRIQPVAPTARGSIFGGTPGQSRIGLIEDLLKGRPSDPVRQVGGIQSILGSSQMQGGGFGGGGLGGGGLGDMLKIGGIGALAAGLGKLAYDEAKDQKGVPLTPLTTMDATGRYNIEAEIARRMGQQAPNPVEFGLLPEGTFPELSGGKPRGMYGGGMVMPMAYAEGGNVAMEDFERMNGYIDGPGTETSDDIPAMLSDGEFVMTGQAVRGAGSFDMQNQGGIVTLTPNGSPDRENGTDLMYQLMEVFSGQARPA